MNTILRERDPGLQPERTALSWQRTAFSAMVLALATVRSGYSQDSLLLTALGSASFLFATLMLALTQWRQKVIMQDTHPVSRFSQCAKSLICLSLCLNSLAVTLQGGLSLFST
ncbi:DUF202 domain-containing protein [Dryocola clanedunensis]|uniref:DUF202 domain-containing protein n=1 Tax=Cedecea sulfonylureivorans TaxID=3051154 RepID=UPI0019275C93